MVLTYFVFFQEFVTVVDCRGKLVGLQYFYFKWIFTRSNYLDFEKFRSVEEELESSTSFDLLDCQERVASVGSFFGDSC